MKLLKKRRKSSFVFFLFWFSIFLPNANGEEPSYKHNHNHHHHDNREMKTTANLPEMSIFHLDSNWQDQSGKTIKLKQFSSKPTIFAMAYTTCQYACPIITSTMLGLEKTLNEAKIKDIQFLLVSLDPKKDTPDRLKKYANKRKMNLKHWTLITGDTSAVQELAVVLGINYKKLDDGEIAHSNVIFLMDQNGIIANKVIGLGKNPSTLVESIKKLKP